MIGAKRFFLIVTVILVALFLVMVDRGVLVHVQKLLPDSETFVVGGARIKRPASWLLTSSRNGRDGAVVYLGLLPGWMIYDEGLPKSKYFAFEDVDFPGSSVTLIELDEEEVEKTRTGLSLLPARGGLCLFQEKYFQGFRSLECAAQNFYSLSIPDLRITVISSGFSPERLDAVVVSREK